MNAERLVLQMQAISGRAANRRGFYVQQELNCASLPNDGKITPHEGEAVEGIKAEYKAHYK